MSLRDYLVPSDSFKWDEKDVFYFPCCVCIYKTKKQTDEPCRTCDHNLCAESELK